jgi:hypothetical protein
MYVVFFLAYLNAQKPSFALTTSSYFTPIKCLSIFGNTKTSLEIPPKLKESAPISQMELIFLVELRLN